LPESTEPEQGSPIDKDGRKVGHEDEGALWTRPTASFPTLEATPSKTSASAAKLEQDLQNERDSRKEERFYFLLAAIMVANIPLFNAFESSWALLPTFLLELVLLAGLAKFLGVDRAVVLIERIFSYFTRKDDKDGGD
jgi:hypothetical protein